MYTTNTSNDHYEHTISYTRTVTKTKTYYVIVGFQMIRNRGYNYRKRID